MCHFCHYDKTISHIKNWKFTNCWKLVPRSYEYPSGNEKVPCNQYGCVWLKVCINWASSRQTECWSRKFILKRQSLIQNLHFVNKFREKRMFTRKIFMTRYPESSSGKAKYFTRHPWFEFKVLHYFDLFCRPAVFNPAAQIRDKIVLKRRWNSNFKS